MMDEDHGKTPRAAASAYDEVLWNFRQFQEQQQQVFQEQQQQVVTKESLVAVAHQSVIVEKSLQDAKQINCLVPRYLTSRQENLSCSCCSTGGVTLRDLQPGSRDEAIHYVKNARTSWTNTPGALDWLCSRSGSKVMPSGTESKGYHASYADVLGKDEQAMIEDEFIDDTSDLESLSEESAFSSEDDENQTETSPQRREKMPVSGNYRRKKRVEYHFMATRDDDVFRRMLGDWGAEETSIQISLSDIKGPDFELEQARKIDEITKMDPRIRLNEYCLRKFQTPPIFTLISEGGPPHERRFCSQVVHGGDGRIHGIGEGSTKKKSELEAARNAIKGSPELQMETADVKKNLETTFRGAATALPFALRFQLERCLFDSNYINVNLRNSKRSRSSFAERNRRIEEVKQLGREMLFFFITKVLPPLLRVFHDFDQFDGAITLSELFAEEIYEPLQCVKQDISKGKDVKFDSNLVREAMERAENALRSAEESGETTEAELGRQENNNFDLIKKRSMWPVAEYRCKFDVSGRLVPTGYEMMNRSGSKEPQSRRALREAGWHVRDRFLLYSSITFDEPYGSHLVDWIAAKPNLCNREYVYLFDKGTGKPDCWLFSPTLQCSRESLLQSIGSFSDVAISKLGDRIGLAFTLTSPIVQLDVSEIIPIPEIIEHQYRFSDGCGVMGLGIAELAKEALGLDTAPGAIQIRIGGVKGMLSVKEDFPTDKIGIRPSVSVST